MVESMDCEAVTYMTSETGFGSLRILKAVDCLIISRDTDVEDGRR